MASEELIDAKLEAFETRMEDKLSALLAEFSLGRPPSLRRSHQGESSDRRENSQEKGGPMTDPPYPCMRVDFPRWKGDSTEWISRAKRYFRYHKTPDASMVDIAAIHLEGDAIQCWIDVKVVDDRILKCDRRCPCVKLMLQDQEIVADFFLLLDDYEAVLGIEWLTMLGDVS
ncbi:hypothetical protein BHM03_00010098 [Ensete ventricosum]|nr:hypothetical protein BHM03_00010098 [Ensete ventricosum]